LGALSSHSSTALGRLGRLVIAAAEVMLVLVRKYRLVRKLTRRVPDHGLGVAVSHLVLPQKEGRPMVEADMLVLSLGSSVRVGEVDTRGSGVRFHLL